MAAGTAALTQLLLISAGVVLFLLLITAFWFGGRRRRRAVAPPWPAEQNPAVQSREDSWQTPQEHARNERRHRYREQ
ncbi:MULTISPECIES: DUF6479 family protein [Streptomyces]|uniref:DUF6479 family protein n=1 Tax=Streptomyces TaxID=1883 RepID=UPI0024747AD4|nr:MULTISPECIES: DUF6479 family protein [Streptomyces]